MSPAVKQLQQQNPEAASTIATTQKNLESLREQASASGVPMTQAPQVIESLQQSLVNLTSHSDTTDEQKQLVEAALSEKQMEKVQDAILSGDAQAVSEVLRETQQRLDTLAEQLIRIRKPN